MNDRGVLSSFLLSLLCKNTIPEITSSFKLVKDSISNRVSDLLIHNTIPVTLYNNLLKFRDTCQKFEGKGDFLKTTTNKNYNVVLAGLSDEKSLYDFAKEMDFDVKAPGNKSTRDWSPRRLLESPGILVSATGV